MRNKSLLIKATDTLGTICYHDKTYSVLTAIQAFLLWKETQRQRTGGGRIPCIFNLILKF